MSETIRSSIGGIIGDICGSVYEHNRYKGDRKNVPLFAEGCDFTDDTVCTIATMDTLLQLCERSVAKYDLMTARTMYEENLRKWCKKYPGRGYGLRFNNWLLDEDMGGYGSYGNDAMMRIGPVAFMWVKREQYNDDWAKMLAHVFTCVTHDSPEAVDAVEALIDYIWFDSNDPILSQDEYRSLEELRNEVKFDETCQGTSPIIYQLYFISRTYEDLIKNAIYIGGDCDTTACIAGSVWCHNHEIPKWMYDKAMEILPEEMRDIVRKFDRAFVVKQ